MMKYTPWVRRLMAPMTSAKTALTSIASGQANQALTMPACMKMATA